MPTKQKSHCKKKYKKREGYVRTNGSVVRDGIPSRVDVVYLKDAKVWCAEVCDSNGVVLDIEDNDHSPIRVFCDYAGNKDLAIEYAREYQHEFGIPIYVYSGSKVVRVIKPTHRDLSQFWNKVGSAVKDTAVKVGKVAGSAAVAAGHYTKETVKKEYADYKTNRDNNNKLYDACRAFARRNGVLMDAKQLGKFYLDRTGNQYIMVDVFNPTEVKSAESQLRNRIRTVGGYDYGYDDYFTRGRVKTLYNSAPRTGVRYPIRRW